MTRVTLSSSGNHNKKLRLMIMDTVPRLVAHRKLVTNTEMRFEKVEKMKTTYIMSVLTSLILMSIIYVVYPRNNISELETRVDNIDQLITQLEANNTQLIASVNNALDEQTAYFDTVQAQLTTSIQAVEESQSTDLTSLNDDIAAVKSLVENEASQRSASITTLKKSIDAINTSLSNLYEEVSALEAAIEDIKMRVNLVEINDYSS
jgi:predicted  nucleic acid-binding Zn-ribbon protein